MSDELRDALSSAFDDDAAAAPPPAVEAPAAAPAAEPAAQVPAPPSETVGERARDDSGRFVEKAKPDTSKPNSATASAAAEPGAQAPAIAPPASWTAAAKAKFAALDPDVQKEVMRREKEMSDGVAQQQSKSERLNAFDAVLAPGRNARMLRGVDDVGYVRALDSANQILERDPVAGILQVGQMYGVNWQALMQRLTGGQPQQGQPPINPVVQRLQTVEQQLAQRAQQEQDSSRQAAQAEIDTFRSDPKNLYFENVKERMSVLIRSGQAGTLQDAYDQAVWADPSVRPLVQAEQEKARQAQSAQAQREKAQQASRAAVSLTGSPVPGAAPGGASSAQTLRGAIEQAWEAAN